MAGRASIDQGPAGDRHQQSAEAAALQPVYRQGASARHRNEPLAVADVDWPVVTAAFGYVRHCDYSGNRFESRLLAAGLRPREGGTQSVFSMSQGVNPLALLCAG